MGTKTQKEMNLTVETPSTDLYTDSRNPTQPLIRTVPSLVPGDTKRILRTPYQTPSFVVDIPKYAEQIPA